MIRDGSNFHAIRIFRYLLIFVLMTFCFPVLRGQTANITVSSPLNEAELNSQSITIDLTDGESFIDLVLPADSFFLTGEPPGTDIESVVGNTLNNAVVHLSFNGTDFDMNYNIGIEISAGELVVTSSGVLASSNTLPVDAFDERVEVVPDASLNELTLDAAYLDITLTEEEFMSTGNIPSTHFTFNHAPAGLTIESVTASDATHARMQLEYPPENDFDSPVTNFSINVSGAILRYTSLTEILTSNELTITAYSETPQASLSIDSTVLEERWLDVRTLTIDLVEERFRDYTTLQIQDFDLVGEPPGLYIGSITRTSAISVDLHLQFDYTDFDGNFPNLRVSIDHLVLVQSGADLESEVEPVIANIESATLAPDILWEDNLDGQILTVTLLNEVFETPGSVDENDFVLVNRPIGLEVVSASAISATQAQLTLHYTGTDFDTDITNFAAGIYPAALRYTSSGNLITGPITIHAVAENPVAHLTSDDVLTENNLDARELTITLDQEEFDPLVTIDSSRFRLENAPPGLTIESAYRLSPYAARILLQFDYHDFDDDITDFFVGIQSSALIQTTSGWLATDSLTIQAVIEHPQANLTADSALTEERLGFRTLYIELEDENFVNWAGLQTHHFELENRPAGLSIQSVTGTTSTSATLVLDFIGTDFDTNYTEFHVLIDSLVLVQSRQDLASSNLTIQASVEPYITLISIPNDTMKIGDTVRVTISVESYQENLFSLNSGEIGGYPLLGPLERVNDTTYISGFIVEEPGNDYAAYENIPVTGVQLYNGLIPGNIYTRTIIQPNDLLDANRPEFIYISDNTPTGEQDIGSEIELMIHTDEAVYTFDTASHVNYVRFTSPAIRINHFGEGYYNLYYTVEEGDLDVSEGRLELELTAFDIAGNRSDPYAIIEPNDLSIDASRPVIDSAYISSTDTLVIAGETLEITVEADQPFYRNNMETLINDIPVGPQITFHDLGTGDYRFRYTVQENDQAVPPGGLEVNIVLQDREPYDNVSITFTDLDSNNVSIRPGKPSAIVSGDTAICFGDSTMIYIRLAGAPPLEFDLTDGTNTVTYENYAQGMHTFWVHPTRTTIYYVTRVVDYNGSRNVGTDSAWITVHPYLDVRIRNLASSYALSAPMVMLDYIPTGGEFEGNGISPTTPWTFTPSLAGVENSPHEIIYTYTDSNTTCSNADTVVVEVIDAPGDILFEKTVACFNDSVFHITGINDGDSPGNFSTDPEPATGGFIDLGNDTAILRPGLFDFDSTADVYIKYTFTDAGGEVRNIMDTLTIERLETARIAPIEDIFCQHDKPIDLSGYPAGGIFSGTGVTGSLQDGFRFNPSEAILDTNQIKYIYTSDNNCSVQDSGQVIVHFSPDANFTFDDSCLPEGGGQIQFQNLTDTGDLWVESWNWNFRYPSNDEENHSDSRDPYHYYEELDTYEVALEVRLENGCRDSIYQSLDLSAYPTADFTWNSTCDKKAEPISFEGWEKIHDPDTISSRIWRVFDRDAAEIFSDTNRLMYYDFLSEGTFWISYRVTTAAGCTDSIVRSITLSPIYNLSEESYYENFEDTLHGWTRMTEIPEERNSWTYGRVDSTHFPWNAETGTLAWYTSLPHTEEIEQSWVESPCFNFEGLDRPMVSLDIKRSLDRNKDGVVLQYTYNGRDWFNVGKRNDGGLNWYNSDGIWEGPGGQNTGWTGQQVFSEDDRWYRAAHDLDELSRHKEVRFRIAYASNGGSTIPNNGFAFDNFTIKQRSRFSVLEYFTNANITVCSEKDTMICGLVDSVPADVINIHYHYHTFGDMPDSIYEENPVPGNSRGTYYGVSKIPMAILDGGGGPFEEVLGYPLVYDFSPSNSPTVEDIRRRSLMEPDFKIEIDIREYTPKLIGTILVEAMSDLTRRNLTLYTVILERMITDEKYEGTNHATSFYQVARKMVRDAAGTILEASWETGDITIIPLEYEEDFFPLTEENTSIVVFIQDDNSREILQAATRPEYDPETAIVRVQPQERVLLYPNPAGELVNVYFETVPRGSMRFSLYDLSGKRVMADVMQPWQQLYTRSLAGLERGLYIVEIRDTDSKHVVYRGKILHY